MICPAYAGEKYYKNEPAVIGGKLVTASGTAPLESAALILKTLDAWYNLNKTHETKYFYELMYSIQ